MARRTTAIDLTASRRYALLKDGVAVSVLDPVHGAQRLPAREPAQRDGPALHLLA
jgi:hypothetical protein